MIDLIKQKNIWIQLIILSGAGYVLFSHTIDTLIFDWSTNPNFSHGFLIPFVCLYMIWFKKNELKETKIIPSFIGLAVIMFAMVIFLLGNIGSELFLLRFSLVLTIAGSVLFYFGFKVFWIIAVPIVYLILMIPLPNILWNQIAFPLQLFSSMVSADLISGIGIPVFREGNILHLSNTSLEVVDACSGIRSLTSLLALTGAFSFLAPLNRINKMILFLSAIPIAIAVNVIRLFITACMAYWISPETAHGFLHDMSGLILFVSALFLVYLVYRIELKLQNIKV